jgi:hypothetical protein
VDFALQGEEGLAPLKKALADGKPDARAFVDMGMPPGWDGVATTPLNNRIVTTAERNSPARPPASRTFARGVGD